MIEFRELSDTPEDFARLKRFYQTLFIQGFPDPDERESIENMQAYLRAKSEGWYASEGFKNSYHIFLAEEQGEVVAAAVCDYLAEPNVGIVEFLLVAENKRGRGLGRSLHDVIEGILQSDARQAGHSSLHGIVIEMNDPFRVDPATDNMDPFDRARLWGNWGYCVLSFPYVQPALSDDQSPVTCLLLCVKPLTSQWQRKVPATTVRQIVFGYLKWAMRIDDPGANLTFQAMSQSLSQQNTIAIAPLLEYMGYDPARPFEIMPILDAESSAYKELMQVYSASFPPGETVIDSACFGRALSRIKEGWHGLHYHLWGVKDSVSGRLSGMASFYALSKVGFAGYITLAPPLRATDRCRLLLARMETQMIRDQPALKGWYIECEPGSEAVSVFEKLGFHRVPFRYLQPSLAVIDPSLPPSSCGPELSLMYKPLGQRVDRIIFRKDEVLDDVENILSGVYRLPDPRQSESFRILDTST